MLMVLSGLKDTSQFIGTAIKNDFIKNNNENSDKKRYILEADFEYPKDLHKFHNDLKLKKIISFYVIWTTKNHVAHIRTYSRSKSWINTEEGA